MILYFVTVLALVALTADGAPNMQDNCFPLYKAIDAFLVFDWKERNSQISNAFSQMTGVDVNNEDEVWAFACGLAGISTVKELADMVPLSYEDVLAMYTEHVESMRKTGGIESTINHMRMRLRIIELGKQLNLTGVDFATIPVQANKDSLISFFSTLSSEFGSNFLDWVYHNGEFRDRDAIFVLDDVDKFATALVESASLEQAATTLGYDKFYLWSMLSSLKTFINEKYGIYNSYIDLIQAFQQYGLYDLKVKAKN